MTPAAGKKSHWFYSGWEHQSLAQAKQAWAVAVSVEAFAEVHEETPFQISRNTVSVRGVVLERGRRVKVRGERGEETGGRGRDGGGKGRRRDGGERWGGINLIKIKIKFTKTR